MRGSEELYRGYQPRYYQGGGGAELDMAERQMDRDIAERRERRAAGERAAREQRGMVSSMGRDIPQAYMGAADWKANQQAMAEESHAREQRYRQGEQQLRQGEQNYQKGSLEKEQMERENAAERAKHEYWMGTEEGDTAPRITTKEGLLFGDTRDELRRQPGIRDTEQKQREANLKQTERQTGLMGAEIGLARRREQREQMQQEFITAVSSGDAGLLADTQAKWGKAGMSPTDLRLAESGAKREKAKADVTAQITADAAEMGTARGQDVVRKVGLLEANHGTLTEAVRGMNTYMATTPGSAQAEAAYERVAEQLDAMGKPREAAQVREAWKLDTAGFETRGKAMKRIVGQLIAEEGRTLAQVESSAMPMRANSVKQQIADLKNRFAQLKAEADKRVDIIGGGTVGNGGPGGNKGFTSNRVGGPEPTFDASPDELARRNAGIRQVGAKKAERRGSNPPPAAAPAPAPAAPAPSLRGRALPRAGGQPR